MLSSKRDRRLSLRRLAPYLLALVLLAWILGSLSRGGTGGGSILANSYWLVYIVELLPLVGVAAMVGVIVFLVYNWRLIADALGYGIAQRRRKPAKTTQRIRLIVFMAVWAIAAVIYIARCGGHLCGNDSNVQVAANTLNSFVSGGTGLPRLPFIGPILAFSSLVDTNFFYFTFLGVLTVASLIIIRAFKVSLDETKNLKLENIERAHEKGREAVKDAIRVLAENEVTDPRTRIILSYQRMIKGAADLGAQVGPDKTARELERGIRAMFSLGGPGIGRLTRLFEEARYSLHEVIEEDAETARSCLLEIQEELGNRIVVAA